VIVERYGAWRSPISAEALATGSLRLGHACLDGRDLYWSEGRPTESGRQVVVRRRPDGAIEDLVPPPFNARTRVHEYGGGAALLDGGTLIFSHFADQRLYRAREGTIVPLTGEVPESALRFADAIIDRARGRLIAIVEDHRDRAEAENALGAIDLTTGALTLLARGCDFYSTPALSPDGRRLVWQSWNHPNMPWDGSDIWVADVGADGTLGPHVHVAGSTEEATFQPAWSPDGVLHFVSDRTGWWNLYRWTGAGAEPVAPMAAEFGQPQWNFGVRTYGFLDERTIVAHYDRDGVAHLARIAADTGTIAEIPTDLVSIWSLAVREGIVAAVGSSPREGSAVVLVDPISGATTRIRRATTLEIDPDLVSPAESVMFPTAGGATAYGLYYAPRNPDYRAPEGERPPLIVMSHGGPTSAASGGFSAGKHYWTSRGFAVLDVNYGGSTGYGRAFRQRLNGQWGVVDVDDCVNGARFLVERGDVDGGRLAITGGSAGGFTTLAALAFRKVFHVGASYYGVSDLAALATDTHKYESRYLDSLVGPYPAAAALYRERSPIFAPERLNCPVIFFQGSEDRVVPPDQAERMVAALSARGITVEYHLYEGEQHGFRQAENIRHALERELGFYQRIFGIAPAATAP